MSSNDNDENSNSSVFSVNDLPEKERYEVWKESISCLFDVDAPKQVRDENFEAEIDAQLFDTLMIATTTSKPQLFDRTSQTISNDGMDHYMIQLFEEGSLLDRTGKEDQYVPEGGLVVFDLAQPATVYTDHYKNISLIIPRHLIEGQLQAPDDQHMRILTMDDPVTCVFHDHLRSLAKHTKSIDAKRACELAPSVTALAASCMNTSPGERRRMSARHPLTAVMMAKQFIRSHLSSPDLSPEFIAKGVGVSRSKLYQLFEGNAGGVSTFVREQRLRKALSLLSNSEFDGYSIYEIALECGFKSDNSFIRSFRERYGLTPGEIRSQAQIEHSLFRAADSRKNNDYEHWINNLAG